MSDSVQTASGSVPSRARVVVIGGGIGGCSILYWLARLGLTDAVLLERSQLTSGSTFHSAGLVGQLRQSLTLTRMMMNSVNLYVPSARRLTSRRGGEKWVRCASRRHPSAWRSCSVRPTGPRRSGCLFTWCPPMRPRRCSR